jgi:hypothetical protein
MQKYQPKREVTLTVLYLFKNGMNSYGERIERSKL